MLKSYTTEDYRGKPLRCIERITIIRALEKTGYNRKKATILLGITEPTLRVKIKQHNI